MTALAKTTLTAAALFVLATAGMAQTVTDPVRIQQALDKQVELAARDMTIREVFEKLTAQTGVNFVISSDALDLLPYGAQTRLAVTLKNVTLQKALSPMLAQQALTWAVDGACVRILPKEGLYRLGRRASFDELAALGAIYSGRLKKPAEGGDPVEQLRALTGLTELKLNISGDSARQAAALQRAERILPCSPSDWLDTLCHGEDWTWYLDGQDLRIIPLKEQVIRQLEKPVTLAYDRTELLTVMLELAREARVKLIMDPGVLDYLPNDVRQGISLRLRTSVQQAMEVLAGMTGLKFVATGDGVRVEASDALRKKFAESLSQPAAQRPRARFFLRTQIEMPDGQNIDLYVLPSELPEDIQQSIEGQKELLVQRLRQKFPATAPATRPSEAQ